MPTIENLSGSDSTVLAGLPVDSQEGRYSIGTKVIQRFGVSRRDL